MPVSTFHRRIVSSVDPEANSLPSGENATDQTQPVCPLNTCISVPVSTFHRRIVLSRDPEANSLPSGENATDWTEWHAFLVHYFVYQVGSNIPIKMGCGGSHCACC